MKTEFWLWLNPDTFIWKSKNEVLVYNSVLSNGFALLLSNVSSSLIERLIDPKQMYCVELLVSEIQDKLTNEFINRLTMTGSGNICEKEEGKPKPVIMFPKLNVQRSVERQSKVVDSYRDDNIMLDLFEMTICFNGITDKERTCWNNQFLYPPVTNKILDSKMLLKHIRLISGSTGLRSINLLGSDFSTIDSFFEIVDSLCQINVSKTIWCRLEDLKGKMVETVKILYEGYYRLMIIVDPICDVKRTRAMIEDFRCELPQVAYVFIIAGEDDYENVERIIDRLSSPIESSIIPLFTGDNMDFFINHVFIQPETLFESKLTKREVFAHQAVNTFDFGKVSLMPDGNFYANLNHPPIGKANENLKEILHRELFTGRSWRRIRDEKPCTDCLYRWLCPSPSNYELAIGRPDLCVKGGSVKPI